MIGGASMGGGDFAEHVAIPGVRAHEWRGRFFEFVTNEGRRYAIDPVYTTGIDCAKEDGEPTVIYMRVAQSICVYGVDGAALWNAIHDRRPL